jgi:hypothetical protein
MYAGAEAKAVAVANLLKQLQAQGTDIQTLAQFEKAILAPKGFSLADLDRFLEHRIASRQLEKVEGLCGNLASPELIESIWQRETQQIQAQAVFFSASNYLQSVTVTPEALGTYFTNQMPRYRTPEQIQVSYVAYPISNFLAQADKQLNAITNLDVRIEAEYARRGSNAFPGLTAEEAGTEIREELRRAAAISAASQEAAVFADKLWQQEPMKPSDLDTLAGQEGLTVKVTSPFDRDSTPAELDVTSDFTEAAYALRDDEPHGGPIPGEKNVYVISLKKRIASANPRFEDVKEEVTRDYRQQQATLKARELGTAFAAGLTNSLTADTSFAEVCTQAGYQAESLPPLSRNTRSLPEVEQHTSLGLFKQVAFATAAGSASSFVPSSDGGFVVYVDSVLPVDEVQKAEELPKFAEAVRQSLEGEAFSFWFGTEAQQGLVNTPLNRPPPGQLTSP